MSIMNVPAAPLFRDPIHDGAADPVIIWNREEKAWWILYTNRRANAPDVGFTWIHGTNIGIASSTDGGKSWLYRGIMPGLEFEHGRNTFWAPEVIWHDGVYHMYMSYVRGIPTTWDWGREIVHYTGSDLWSMKFESILSLSSKRVIDACVFRVSDGKWRMLYKDENNSSHTYLAESDDLYEWEVIGPQITDCAHEGPNVFLFKGSYWLITDFWKGLGVYKSEDGISWTRQEDILDKPGTRNEDGAYGHHADILVQGERAFIFYFTHPESMTENVSGYALNRTSLQVAELEVVDGKLVCDRSKPFDFHLQPEG